MSPPRAEDTRFRQFRPFVLEWDFSGRRSRRGAAIRVDLCLALRGESAGKAARRSLRQSVRQPSPIQIEKTG